MKNLIYITLFGDKKYLDLVDLLIKSIKLFGDPNNIDFLIISNTDYKESQNIFNTFGYNIDFYYIESNNFLYSLSSRLLIFNYHRIHEYNKILYIDTDILITNNINNIFNLNLENKLYALIEGTIDDDYHGREFFNFNTIYNKTTSFTSGILLFNNCNEIKNLFNTIMNEINNNIHNNGIKPVAYDQAFINYHAIINNLYDNTLLSNYCVNNPELFKYNNHVICHFPGGVGNYIDKYNKMKMYLLYIYDLYPLTNNSNNNFIANKKFAWKHDCINKNGEIYFKENNCIETTWGNGTYQIIDNHSIKVFWCNDCHLLKFNNNYITFISIRRLDYNVSSGNIIN
jgi:hypothetical protein